MATVFYSWQSDLPNRTNRNFVQDALNRAIVSVLDELEIEEAERDDRLAIDHDTRGVAGTPSITDTIFKKIAEALIFVPDLSFVASSEGKRLVPNPNVLIEYGYAVSVLGHSRLIPVMNTAYGAVDDTSLPFDMRHLRRPITFHLEEDATSEDRAAVRTQLIQALSAAIRLIVDNEGFEVNPVQQFESPWPLEQKEFLDDERTLVPRNESMFRAHKEMYLPEVSCVVLRIIPGEFVEPFRYPPEVEKALSEQHVPPFGGGSHNVEKNKYGAVSYSFSDEGQVIGFSQVHLNKEIWSADYHYLDLAYQQRWPESVEFGCIPWSAIHRDLIVLIRASIAFYEAQGVSMVGARVALGMFGIEGYKLALDSNYFEQYGGDYYQQNLVIERDVVDALEPESMALNLIVEVFDAFGVKAPAKLVDS